MRPDPVQRVVEEWRRERPELDVEAVAVLGRLMRVARAVDARIDAVLQDRFGLQPGWFDLLSALRRSGEPFRLSAGALAGAVMLSSGGMTKRLDRMEAAGLIERLANPGDRRGVLVGLTAQGRRTIDAAIEAHVANEESMLEGLSARDRQTLERLLRKLGASVER